MLSSPLLVESSLETMARTTGAKDKNPRYRKKMTPAAKKARADKKTREAAARSQQAKSRFIANMAGLPPDEDSTENEPEIQYDEIIIQGCNGATDLGDIDAVLDDEYESADNEEDNGIMKEYMKAIMKRQIIPVGESPHSIRTITLCQGSTCARIVMTRMIVIKKAAAGGTLRKFSTRQWDTTMKHSRTCQRTCCTSFQQYCVASCCT